MSSKIPTASFGLACSCTTALSARIIATGRVRLLCLDPGSDLGGEKVAAPVKPAG